jgi:hypothetical protein
MLPIYPPSSVELSRQAEKPVVPIRVMCHGRKTLKVATRFGWLPGARYTNLRDIRGFSRIGLIDIEWSSYNFSRHLEAVKATNPLLTVARDVDRESRLERTLDEADILSRWASTVVIVPKFQKFNTEHLSRIPPRFVLGYSVPTRYGGTRIPLEYFLDRPVHLLGGRPDVQYRLSQILQVWSVDGNRVTLDAQYGDYFDGEKFRPHPSGGYYECIRASLAAINRLWRIRLNCDSRLKPTLREWSTCSGSNP